MKIRQNIPAPFTDWVLWQNSGGTGPNATHLSNGAAVDTNKAKDLSLWQSAVVPDPLEPSPLSNSIPDPVLAPALPTQDPVVIPVQVTPPLVPASSNILVSIWQTLSGLFK